MNQTSLIIGLIALGVGWGAGYLCGNFTETPVNLPPSSDIKAAVAADNLEVNDLRAEVDQLKNKNSDLLDQLSRPAPEQPAAIPAVTNSGFWIPKKFVTRLSMQIIDSSGLTKDVKECLNLTDQEVAVLNPELAASRDRLKDLQMAHESLVSQAPGVITVAVAPFEQEGKAVYAQLEQQVDTALGMDRGNALMSFVDQSAYYFGNDFGKAKQQVTITAQAGGNYQISTKSEMGSGTSTTVGNYGKIPDEYAHLFDSPSTGASSDP